MEQKSNFIKSTDPQQGHQEDTTEGPLTPTTISLLLRTQNGLKLMILFPFTKTTGVCCLYFFPQMCW